MHFYPLELELILLQHEVIQSFGCCTYLETLVLWVGSQGFYVSTPLPQRFTNEPSTPPESSVIRPGVPGSPPLMSSHSLCYFKAQVLSHLLIKSHWLAFSVALERALMAWLWAWPRISMSPRSLVVDMPTKPLHPASTGRTLAFQVCCSASATSSVHLNLLGSYSLLPGHLTKTQVLVWGWSRQSQMGSICPRFASNFRYHVTPSSLAFVL